MATENVASSVCACLLGSCLLFFDDDGDSGAESPEPLTRQKSEKEGLERERRAGGKGSFAGSRRIRNNCNINRETLYMKHNAGLVLVPVQ